MRVAVSPLSFFYSNTYKHINLLKRVEMRKMLTMLTKIPLHFVDFCVKGKTDGIL